MPKVHDNLESESIRAALAAREDFEGRFKRSARGTLWQKTRKGLLLSVFQYRDNRYGWCIGDDSGPPKFSRGRYADEGEAVGALWDEVQTWV